MGQPDAAASPPDCGSDVPEADDGRRAAGTSEADPADESHGVHDGRLAETDDTALTRAQRVGARFVGAGLIVYCLAMAPGMVRFSSMTAPWWLPLSVALIVVPSAALVGCSFCRTPDWAVPVGVCCSVGYLLATSLWFLAWTGESDDEARWPVWLVQFPGIPAMALVLALRFRLAAAHLVAATALVHTANQLALYGHLRPAIYTNAVLTMGLTGVFLAIGIVGVRTAQTLDRTRTAAIRAAASTASDAAREAERSRYDALVHDHVIACLLALRPGTPEPRLIDQARDALGEIDAWHRGDGEAEQTVEAPELLRRLRFAAVQIDRDVTFDVTVAGQSNAYPGDVSVALVDAMSEALRNSVRHAGADASRAVAGELGESVLWVAVLDDGVGFDPDRVDGQRYGINIGLRRRMGSLPGGDLEVRSIPGRGTMVGLSWVTT